MPTQIEDELGLGPAVHRVRLWFRNRFGRMGGGLAPQDRRSLDPLTVNYAAWNAVKHHTREWPHYQEAPNLVEVYVSPEDWEDYWGVDAERKEYGVAAYVQAQAAKHKLWMAGDAQVQVYVDDGIDAGGVDVVCRFVEPVENIDSTMASSTSSFEPLEEESAAGGAGGAGAGGGAGGAGAGVGAAARTSLLKRPVVTAADKSGAMPVVPGPERPGHAEEVVPEELPPTERFADAEDPDEARLVGEGGFCLVICPGDCIGAVRDGEDVPEEVNVRLDALGFPYVDAKQCTLDIIDGKWHLTNHAAHGTRLLLRDGTRLMLGEGNPYPLNEGDVLYLGPTRPLRFMLGSA